MRKAGEFFEFDYMHTLFPLRTNLLMVQSHQSELQDFIYQQILDPSKPAAKFLPQQRVYAPKRHGHLRRTFKLDPVAEYFLYDLVFRNRARFRKPFSDARKNFGYRFSSGKPMPISGSYRAFGRGVKKLRGEYKYSLSIDIASYFNSLYHHDLVTWLEDTLGAGDGDVLAFGEFLREINVGRSVDCLPQGIYPAKMIGNAYLKMIDQHFMIRSAALVRFMDDFVLLDNSLEVVEADFVLIQKLLGEKGLNVNPAKTVRGSGADFDLKKKVSAIRRKLRTIVEEIEHTESGVELFSTVVVRKLTKQEVTALLSLLEERGLEEEDAEVILALLQKHSSDAVSHLPGLLVKFPNLSKSIYRFSGLIADKSELLDVVTSHLGAGNRLDEFQLFWLGAIVDDFLLPHVGLGKALPLLWDRASAIDARIAMAKVLEMPEKKYGMLDLKEQYLRTGQSDWLAWASAMGLRGLAKAKRNHLLGYFGNASPMNHLVAECVSKL